ncbi:MAG: PAS domain S-box protein, partial [Calditrichaeota bacterium]
MHNRKYVRLLILRIPPLDSVLRLFLTGIFPDTELIIQNLLTAGQIMSTSEKQLPSPVMTGADNGSRNWENLVDALGAIIWEADPETTQFTFVSQKAEELLGYPCEQWLTEPDFWVKHLHPEDRKWAVEFCREATAALEPHDFEYRFIAADGRTVWLRDIVTVIAEGGKPVRLWGVMIDVTRQKELKAELAFQKTLLESLMETSPEGILVVSPDRKWLTYNRRFIEMWNIPEEVVRSRSSEAALKAVQNLLEDPREFQAKIEYLYAHPHETSRDEIRLRDGRIFDRYSAPVRDNAGRHYGRAWFYRDITHQKRIEEKLRFAQFSVDQAPETILWVDRQGRILYANEAAGKALGYSREALQQLRVSDIDPNFPAEKWDEHWQICKREGTRRLETMHRRKDGSLIPVEVSINHLEFQGEEYH